MHTWCTPGEQLSSCTPDAHLVHSLPFYKSIPQSLPIYSISISISIPPPILDHQIALNVRYSLIDVDCGDRIDKVIDVEIQIEFIE